MHGHEASHPQPPRFITSLVAFNAKVPLSAGVYLCLAGGSYSYDGLSKDYAELDSTQASIVRVCIHSGAWMALLGGLFYDRFGPLLTGYIGSVLIFVSFLSFYLVESSVFKGNFFLLCFLGFLAGQGCAWVRTAALVTNARNTAAEDRGAAFGILLACYGLADFVFSLLQRGFFPKDKLLFLVFCAVASSTVCFISTTACFVMDFGTTPTPRKDRMYFLLVVIVLLYCLVAHILTVDYDWTSLGFAIGLLGLVSLFIFLPLNGSRIRINRHRTLSASSAGSAVSGGVFSLRVDDYAALPSEDVDDDTTPDVLLDKSPLSVLRTREFWFLFFAFLLSVPAGPTVADRLDALTQVLEGQNNVTDPTSNLLTSILVFASCIGRLFCGLVADFFSHRVQRSAWLLLSVLSVALSCMYLAIASLPMLYFGVAWLGLSFGSVLTLVPTLCAEFWGVRYFGGNDGLILLAPAAGLLSLNVLVADRFLKLFADDSGQCNTPNCYQYTFWAASGGAFLGCVFAALLWIRRANVEKRESMPTAPEVT